ncbi:uncharacterized protein J8A68_001732 [[Candida] subhashii]|uniref:SWIM-type domain-containing protein n=1 Tax=[Candida] subhashii TaxID=561895 RepID=A0A8J5QKF0_9ASCO|nr:uncharacterized protein J8A68_001732 [[Candida] subhashii]KAG7664707.1 hypothetical protein J8A68_001732 [[Candida] subhashii]
MSTPSSPTICDDDATTQTTIPATPENDILNQSTQNEHSIIDSTHTNQILVPPTRTSICGYVPGPKFLHIASSLPGFEHRSDKYIYNYKGLHIQKIFETIQRISLWFSPSYRACRFPCSQYSEGCRAYISLSNDETPELEWKYNHNHDCLSDQYFVDNNEELKMQKFILEHYLELDWEDQRIKYCENLNRSNLLTFDSCYGKINLLYKHIYYRIHQHDDRANVVEDFKRKPNVFQDIQFKEFENHRLDLVNPWAVILFTDSAGKDEILHVNCVDGLAIDIVPPKKLKDHKGTITLLSVMSRSKITGRESPKGFMVTNLICEQTLSYFFDKGKNYFQNARGIVIDCDHDILNSVKTYLPNVRVTLCPLSVNEVLCQTWKRNENSLPNFIFLTDFFQMASTKQREVFSMEWKDFMSNFGSSEKWRKSLQCWYDFKEYWQVSYSELPSESNQFVIQFHNILKAKYIGRFAWKYFSHLLESLNNHLTQINLVFDIVIDKVEPRILSQIENKIWKKLVLQKQSSDINVADSLIRINQSTEDETSNNVEEVGTYQYNCSCDKEFPFQQWCEHILSYIINNEDYDDLTFYFKPGQDGYVFPDVYHANPFNVEAVPESIPIFPDINVEEEEYGVFTQIDPNQFQDDEDENGNKLGVQLDSKCSNFPSFNNRIKRAIRQQSLDKVKKIKLINHMDGIERILNQVDNVD